MRTAKLWAGGCGLSAWLVLAGCGGGPTPAEGPNGAGAGAAAGQGAAGQEGVSYDLSPVERPALTVGMMRFKSPMATAKTAASALSLPPGMLDKGAASVVEGMVDELLDGQVDVRQMASVIALDAPVDAIMVLDDNPKKLEPHAAFAVGLQSLEGAKMAAEAKAPLLELAPGVFKTGGKERSEPTCVIAASSGPTPARLVCGPREKDVAALTPYLTRTVTTQPAPVQDVAAEVFVRPLEERFGNDLRRMLPMAPQMAERELGIGNPTFDKALKASAEALGDEANLLIGDADRVGMSVAFQPDELAVSMFMTLRSTNSWIGGTIADTGSRAGAAPAFFWQLPKDSDSAFFSQGSDPKRYEKIMAVGRDFISGGLEELKVGNKADRDALADLLRLPLKKETASVQASGSMPMPADASKLSAQQRMNALMNATMGWNIIGFNEKSDALEKWLKDMVAAYNRPGLQALLRKEMGSDAKSLPRVSSKPAAGLGAGAVDFEISVPNVDAPSMGPNSKAGSVTLTFHVLMMPDGNNTWIAIGADLNELSTRLKSVKSGAPKDNTLASRSGLDALKSGKRTSGGYLTVGSFTNNFINSLGAMAPMGADPELDQVMKVLNSLPNKGATPIMITSNHSAQGGTTADVRLQVPGGAIKDIAAMATSFIGMMM